MSKIIDCHCHIYPDKIAAKAVESIGKFYDLPMRYNGTASQMISESRKAGITGSVVFSVATTPHQVASINNFIADEVKKGPSLCGLGAAHPLSEDQKADIDEIASLGLKGVKLHPDIQGFAIDDPRCMEIYRLCRERGLTVLIHMGDKRYDFSSPKRLIPVLEQLDGLKIIGAHLGGWGIWKDAESVLSGYDNFSVDCSSSLAFLPPEEAKRIIRLYGANRVLFGTDYPMWDYNAELERFFALGLSDEERELILHRNAEEIFDIEG